MLRNYLLTILRQIRKNRLFSFVNLLGLALGMASCLIIAQYVFFHSGFDKNWDNVEDIYRVQTYPTKNDIELGASGQCAPMMGYTLAQSSPEVLHMTRLYTIDYQNNSFLYGGEGQKISFQESEVYAADASFFDVFNITFAAGGPARFKEPNTMILTQSTALKYEDEVANLIGKNIVVAGNVGEKKFEIIGIIEDLPKQSHLQFNTLFSFQNVKDDYGVNIESWSNNGFFTYLKLKPDTDSRTVLNQIKEIHEANAKPVVSSYGFEIDYDLMPVDQLHMYSKAQIDFKPTVDYRLIYALAGIALLILIIAWINYLNLSLVKVLDRLKEVGIRKALGSRTQQITMLFTLEAVTLNIMSFLLALTLAQLTSPYTANLTGIEFNILDNMGIVSVLFIIVVIGSLLIGSYPAIMLKTFNTSNILTGNRKKQKIGGLGLRSSLVSFQFIITFLLIAATVTVYKQIRFMKNSDLGIKINDTMVIKAPPGDISQSNRPDRKKFNAFKTALKNRSEIVGVTNTGEIPGQPISWGGNLRRSNQSQDESIAVNYFSMGQDFFDFFDIKLITGRKLEGSDGPWTNGAVIINEKLAELLGFENPEDALEQKLSGFYAPNPVVVKGVVENHHQTSLHDDFPPVLYVLSSWTEFYFVKFAIDPAATNAAKATQLKASVNLVESEWNKSFTDTQLDYYFLDQAFNSQYEADEQFGSIFGAFSSLAILIACLGLYGLTTFTLRQRTKEIGIRKVLGADLGNLAVLLSRSYFLLIGVAYVLSMPFAWIFLGQWLENYHFRIELGSWLLAIPLGFVCLVAFLTIISRVVQSVKVNPVDSLKYE